MNFEKASLQIILAGILGIVFIGGIAYLSALITKNTLPEEGSGESRGGYAIFSPETGTPEQKSDQVEYAKEEWTTYGGDYYNRRYSELEQVNLATIQDLKPVWVTSLGMSMQEDSLGEAAPIVVDGVMYIAAGSGAVTALDAATGETIWSYQSQTTSRPDEECCSRTTHGVAVGEEHVYVGNADTTLVALDQKSGEVVWKKEIADWEQGYRITSAPLYYNGKVYTGISGGHDGIGGHMVALDAKNGRDVWEFHDLPDVYSQQEETKIGQEGGITSVWNTPAVDPELETVYFAAGYMTADSGREHGQGNLYTNMIVAVNAESGEYVWHFEDELAERQEAESTNPVVLFNVEHEGEKKKALGQAGKKGWVYLLDRKEGSPLLTAKESVAFQLEEQKSSTSLLLAEEGGTSPSATENETIEKKISGKFKERASSVFTPFRDSPVIEPSTRAGEVWQPSAYSPKTEYYYILGESRDAAMTSMDEADKMYVSSVRERAAAASRQGLLTALDIKTNQIAWQVNWNSVGYASILATAGDVVFAGGREGQINALHASTGKEVWSYRTGASINTPAVTYEIDGDQYVSVVSADNVLVGAVYSQKLYTFKLDGTWNGLGNGTSTELTEE